MEDYMVRVVTVEGEQQGWEEGDGLGKDKQGIKGYVRVKNKQDTAGCFLDTLQEIVAFAAIYLRRMNLGFGMGRPSDLVRCSKTKMAFTEVGGANWAKGNLTMDIGLGVTQTETSYYLGLHMERETIHMVSKTLKKQGHEVDMREMQLIRGSVKVYGSLAYVSQVKYIKGWGLVEGQ
ncbi:hypothetical protein QJS04_geneDACA021998 [Acorus gramineus]|uniref:G-patch domain-containing protein n=1 Tax=Acorus gramineus TaxID=55184 RepID=A0AAV9A1L4_ACOGR|nr:hypothetical protein QJS04_geneDACA021998 [Acorus gramineus]